MVDLASNSPATSLVKISNIGPFDGGAYSCLSKDDVAGSWYFWLSKRIFDLVVALCALPLVALISITLSLVNPWCNPGPLLFLQKRMGRHGLAFTAIKFRTMLPADSIARGPHDALEDWRITPLGGFLRRTRIDEFPQFINVLVGDMSVIGPRPDYIEHARHFAATMPGYRERHVVRPGISGAAQVKLGYAEGEALTRAKTLLDHDYIRTACWRNEAAIIWRTLFVMISGFGAR